MLRMKTLFISQGSLQLLGINPEDLTLTILRKQHILMTLKETNWDWLNYLSLHMNFLLRKRGELLLSTNFRFRNTTGNYVNQLVQCYLFYSPLPNDTVYMVNINTDIDGSKKPKTWFPLLYRKERCLIFQVP